MYIDIEELRRLNRARLLNLVDDQASGLLLADYSARAQFDDAWDAHPVLLDCRGLILAADGRVVAKTMRKFFNLSERPETQPAAVAELGKPEITHKLDGSMATLFYSQQEGIHRFATRGSFTSAQAQHATELWRARYDGTPIDSTLTYIFEVIYPGNRIVVDYQGRDELVLIGLVETETGKELPYTTLLAEATRIGLSYVELEPTRHWPSLAGQERPNFEGFVLFWPEQQLRIKVKLEEYVRLHRIIMGVNEHAVWETLSMGTGLEGLRQAVPEEIRAWIDDVAGGLVVRFTDLEAEMARLLGQLRSQNLDPGDRTHRRELAGMVLALYPPALRPAAFLALDGKQYGHVLWKQLEPQGTGKAPAIESAS